MNSFDASIIAFLNHFAHRSQDLDYLIMLIGSNELIKGGVITAFAVCKVSTSGVGPALLSGA
ncbi:MAG: hypothetical protein WA886_14090 [Candidatus Acidiferrales bacterium]